MKQSPLPPMPFEALLPRLRGGDDEAWQQVEQQLRPYLLSCVRRAYRAASEHDAADLVQSTLTRSLAGIGRFRGTTHVEFRAWLGMIAQNLARGRRKQSHTDPAPLPDGSGGPGSLASADETPSKLAVKQEDSARVKQAIEQLSHDDQVVLTGHIFAEQSHAELAKQLERSEEAVRQLYSRAIKKLAAALEKR